MSLEQKLKERSQSSCEFCKCNDNLTIYEIPPDCDKTPDQCLLVCQTCSEQIEHPENMDSHHWRCLNDSMWSPVPAVQIMSWRLLNRLSHEGWPQELLEMLYLDEDLSAWAKADGDGSTDESIIPKDCNGTTLESGDTVTLTKDLNVKGANFTAKRGTAVRGISLVTDNAEQIEGKVNGQQIVILTKFVKKSG